MKKVARQVWFVMILIASCAIFGSLLIVSALVFFNGFFFETLSWRAAGEHFVTMAASAFVMALAITLGSSCVCWALAGFLKEK